MILLKTFGRRGAGRRGFSFLDVNARWLKTRLDDYARNKLLGDLRNRCDWDLANPDKIKKGREDMKNISPAVDYYASTAYLRGQVLRGKWEDKLPQCAVKTSKK